MEAVAGVSMHIPSAQRRPSRVVRLREIDASKSAASFTMCPPGNPDKRRRYPDYSVEYLLSKIAVVFQDTYLFAVR
jgi:hypothetical protein